MKNEYQPHADYDLIDAFRDPDGAPWTPCPRCNLPPKVWLFDNGRHTGCGCRENTYRHFAVRAESIMSCYRRTGNTVEYDSGALRVAWESYCTTGETEPLAEGTW